MAESDLSTEVNATTVLPAASGVSATASGGDVDVSWSNNDDSSDGGIDVERRRVVVANDFDDGSTGTWDGFTATTSQSFDGSYSATDDGTNFGNLDSPTFSPPSETFESRVWCYIPSGSIGKPHITAFESGSDWGGPHVRVRNGSNIEYYDGNWNDTGSDAPLDSWFRVRAVMDLSAQDFDYYLKPEGGTETQIVSSGGYIPRASFTAGDERFLRLTAEGGSNIYYDNITVQTAFAATTTGVAPSTTSYTDTSVSEGATYEYRIERNTDHATATSGTGGVRIGVNLARSLATGSSGASLSARTIDSTRAATTGETGASASTRAATKPRSTATGSAGASRAARAATKPRSAATGATGRSVAARVVDNIRRSTTGSTGASVATRAAAKSRSTTTGETGASTSSRVATVARSLTTGSSGRSLAARAFDNWRIDGEGLAVTPDLEATAETLTLTAEVGRDRLDALRALGDRAGDLTTEEGHAGAFRALDRGGDSPVDVLAPVSERPPFPTTASFLIAGYSESQLSPARFEVAFELQRLANRSDATAPDTLQTGDDWLLTLDSGDVVGLSERQVGQVTREGTPPGADVALTVRVSSDQAGALLDRLGYPDGVVARSVPDGPDQRVDETGGRQTISVDAPSAASVASGDWFVTDWTLTFNSYSEDRQWLVELALAEP